MLRCRPARFTEAHRFTGLGWESVDGPRSGEHRRRRFRSMPRTIRMHADTGRVLRFGPSQTRRVDCFATFGRITSTVTSSRQIQLGVRAVF